MLRDTGEIYYPQTRAYAKGEGRHFIRTSVGLRGDAGAKSFRAESKRLVEAEETN